MQSVYFIDPLSVKQLGKGRYFLSYGSGPASGISDSLENFKLDFFLVYFLLRGRCCSVFVMLGLDVKYCAYLHIHEDGEAYIFAIQPFHYAVGVLIFQPSVFSSTPRPHPITTSWL